MPKRRNTRSRRQRWIDWWVLWRIPVLLAVLMLVWWYVYRPYAESRSEWVTVDQGFAICGEGGTAPACIIDGDTVALGFGGKARRIRLTGFDAPEIKGACPVEVARAHQAKQALYRWLNAGDFEWDGGADPPRDRYGRELRTARRTLSDGSRQMLADYMIDADLAEGPGPWQRQNWCD